jgi:hypothetical protein
MMDFKNLKKAEEAILKLRADAMALERFGFKGAARKILQILSHTEGSLVKIKKELDLKSKANTNNEKEKKA